jgi:hypothetical protein
LYKQRNISPSHSEGFYATRRTRARDGDVDAASSFVLETCHGFDGNEHPLAYGPYTVGKLLAFGDDMRAEES